MNLFEDSGATFSDCRQYRYALWRIWDRSLPLVMFIGLNPSTANESTDDPTIRRVISFAKDWGYGGVYMTNLFAIVSADPKILLTCDDPLGDNDSHLRAIGQRCNHEVLFAWGNFKEAEKRAALVSQWFPEAKVLALNKNGSPKHPLYIKGDTIPIPFPSREVLKE